jgi:hypothetical protein
MVVDDDVSESEVFVQPRSQKLVVITDGVGNFRTTFRVCKNPSYDVAMFLWPIPASLKFPSIDEITDDKEIVTAVVFEERAEKIRLTRFRS